MTYDSLTIAAKELEIYVTAVCKICQKKSKYATSKLNNQRYSFRYAD